ncbi:MAG: hypothetical protein KF817_02245 [Phycisphaeraceae bacterium]|nr:hypothetical protein [Phycisphaeraceae bacterium]
MRSASAERLRPGSARHVRRPSDAWSWRGAAWVRVLPCCVCTAALQSAAPLTAAAPGASGHAGTGALGDLLSPQDRIALDAASEGRDRSDEAFAVLVEALRALGAARRADVTPGRQEVVDAVDLDAVLAAPDAHRARAMRVRGRIEQRTRLVEPWSDVEEWFVRDAARRPIALYVVDSAGAPAAPDLRPGSRIDATAWFYKSFRSVGRDGVERRYAGFVTHRAHVALDARGAGRGRFGAPGVLVGALALLAGTCILLALGARALRPRGGVPALVGAGGAWTGAGGTDDDGAETDASDALPEDPIAALRVLRDRALP